MSRWPLQKVEACLKRIIHSEFLPSKQELDEFSDSKALRDDDQLMEFLKFIHKKSRKLEIYGTAEEMFADIKKINKISQFIKFSSCPEVEVSGLCALLTIFVVYSEKDGEIIYTPKTTILTAVYSDLARSMKSRVEDEIVARFFSVWQTANHNKCLRDLKGSYDLIRLELVKSYRTEIDKIFETKPTITLPKKTITIEWFKNLSKYFEPEEMKLFEQLMDSLKDQEDLIKSKQEYYKTVYGTIDFFIKETKKFFERHSKSFTPNAKLKQSAMPKKPIVRRVQGNLYHYFLAEEVENAIKIVMKNRSSKSEIPEGLIVVESEAERNLGIVYAIQSTVFKEILTKLKITPEDLTIVEEECSVDFREITLPIVSSYGTHCIPALEAFNTIIYYLAVVLKVFQRSNNLQLVFKWIDKMMGYLFAEKSIMYLIEVSRIDKMIDKARKDFSAFLTEPAYEIAFQETYTRNEVFQEFEKMSRSLGIEKRAFITTTDHIIDGLLDSPTHIKDIYYGYYKIVQFVLKSTLESVDILLKTQHDYSNQIILEMCISDFFAEQLKEQVGEVEKKQETVSSPKSKSENAEIKKLREDLEKSRKSEAQLQEKLKTQEAKQKYEEKLLKISEKQAQKLETELEKLKKSKKELQEKMEGQLKTVNSNFEEQIQKLQEDLEKSQISEAALEEKLKTKSEEQKLQKVQEDLEKSEKSKIKLEEELKMQLKSVTSDFEEQIRKFQEELEKYNYNYNNIYNN